MGSLMSKSLSYGQYDVFLAIIKINCRLIIKHRATILAIRICRIATSITSGLIIFIVFIIGIWIYTGIRDKLIQCTVEA